MMNDLQREYTVDMIKKNNEEANKADSKAFWELIGLNACVILLGVASYLGNKGVIGPEITTGAQVLTGIGGTVFLTETISNNTKRIASEKRANELNDQLNLDKLDDEAIGRVRTR